MAFQQQDQDVMIALLSEKQVNQSETDPHHPCEVMMQSGKEFEFKFFEEMPGYVADATRNLLAAMPQLITSFPWLGVAID